MRHLRNTCVRAIGLVTALLVILSGGLSSPPSAKGVVTGRIAPCMGLPIPDGPRYAAGTVFVLQGQVRWKSEGHGNYVDMLPSDVVARQDVATNQAYWFALEPG